VFQLASRWEIRAESGEKVRKRAFTSREKGRKTDSRTSKKKFVERSPESGAPKDKREPRRPKVRPVKLRVEKALFQERGIKNKKVVEKHRTTDREASGSCQLARTEQGEAQKQDGTHLNGTPGGGGG